jgi:hypothetical protein
VKVYLVYCKWVPDPELHGVFSTPEKAERYIDRTVGTPCGPGYYNKLYRREQFFTEEWEVDVE